MNLSDKQWLFLQDEACLVYYIKEQGLKASGGELERDDVRQQALYDAGLSTKQAGESDHNIKLAIDLNFWDRDGVFVEPPHPEKYTAEERKYVLDRLQHVGIFWKSLSKKNYWGGDWRFFDPRHFGRRQ
jgi:hypothetical protein